ncbi:hypothetical protein BGZ60DRAFT_534458 [Tricladium varicosporioides]|nr:hypothetical protein BGZ60DRAFT_534458 [Hymenoscyphus varicosporioides]
MSHMDNTVLITTPSFGPDFYNEKGAITNYPLLGGDTLTFLRSQVPPPALFGATAPPQTINAVIDTLDTSPSLLSPRVTRESKPRQSKVIGDLAATFRHRSEPPRLDIKNNSREHPLYQNVTLDNNGLYHCPWESQGECQHQPSTLNKQVDSHLFTYRCKESACGHLHFSSSACLLRHEREAHGMHGHGDKPYLCTHESCERSVPGNGFPRHWNLRDHMKRVHNDLAPTEREVIRDTSVRGKPPKGTKRKANSMDWDETPKSNATPPAEIGQLCESRLLECYHQHEQRLLELVKQLHDPRNAINIHLL